MKKLLKAYEFTSVYQYFDMILESQLNGQRKQAEDQFLSMPRVNRKEFCIYLLENCEVGDISKFINLI